MQKLLLTFFLLSLPLFASLPAMAGAQTLSDLESRIAALLAQIQTLQSELQTLKIEEATETPQASVSSSFTTTLGKGSEGADVTRLQQYLASDPTLYPEGLITGYYGSLTEAAVKRFQQKHNIVSSGTPLTTGYGHVGPATRAKLNSLLVTTSSSTTPLEPSGSQANPASNGAGPLNRSPNLSITGERSLTLPNKATLTALATDDGLPANTPASPAGRLTYFWSKASGPGTATFSSLTTKDTTITFSAAGTYQITATVSDGDLFASYTIALTALPPSTSATTTPPVTTLPAPTLAFTASQTSLTKGSSTTLSWVSTNALSCTATNGWSGSKTSSGSTTLTPQTSTTYTLSCKGGGGDSVAKSVTVSVAAAVPLSGPACNVIFASGFEGSGVRFVGKWGPYLTGVDSVFDKIYPGRSDWSALPFHDSDNTESTGAFFNHIVGNRLYNGVGKMSLEYAYTDIVNDISYGGGASLHSKVSKASPEAGDGNMSRMQWEYALKPDHGLERGYIGFRMRLPSDLEAIMADNRPRGNWQQLFQLRELVDGCEYQPSHTMYSTDVVISYNANATPKLRFWTHRGTHYCNGTNYDGSDTSQQAVPADGEWHHYEFFWDRDAGMFRFKLDGEIVVDWSGVKMKIAKPMHKIKPIYMYTSEPWEGDATRQPIERWYDDLYICDNRPTGF